MANTTQTRVIKVTVDTKNSAGLREIANAMGGLNKSVKTLGQSFSNFKNTVLGFTFLGLGVRELVSFSDEMQNLNSRLVILTGTQEKANVLFEELHQIANDTKVSIASTADSYSRFALSLKGAGISQGALLAATKTIVNTFRLSGSTATETAGAMVQLSQAFSRGALRGQELNSVLSQNATLSDLLRKKFGKDLFKVAEAGGITVGKVFELLADSMDDINAKATLLKPTFEQSATKAINDFKFAILGVNEQLDLSGKFAKGLDMIAEKIGLIGVAIGLLALTQIPALISAISKIAIAAGTLNPYVAVFAAVGFGIVAIFDNFDQFRNSLLKLDYWILQGLGHLLQLGSEIVRMGSKVPGLGKYFDSFSDTLEDTSKNVFNFAKSIKEDVSTIKLPTVTKPEKTAAEEMADAIKKLKDYYEKTGEKAKKVKELLADLNKEFISGKIDAEEYGAKIIDFNLKKLNKEFAEGKINLFAYNEGLNTLKRQGINRAFAEGVITIQQFNDEISKSNVSDLDSRLKAGTISLQQYRVELVKVNETFSAGGALQAGATNYLNSIGTVGQQTAQVIQNAFTGLETVFLDFIKNGKASFASFTKAILDDLTRIIIRASIIRPLAEGILQFGARSSAPTEGTRVSGGTMSNQIVNAKGNVFDRGLKKFAKGGIVNGATSFGYGQGKSGLMGEAGPEAILPLQRGAGGNLGVAASVNPVTINIINKTDVEIEQRETTGPSGERTIELMISNKVKEGIANGSYDRVMKSSFGLTRRGN